MFHARPLGRIQIHRLGFIDRYERVPDELVEKIADLLVHHKRPFDCFILNKKRPLHSTFGLSLYRARLWRGFTQIELARLAGTSQSVISQVETGRRLLGRNLAVRLAEVLETHPRSLM